MFEKINNNQNESVRSSQLIREGDPKFYRITAPEAGGTAIAGSIYLGDARTNEQRMKLDDGGVRRLDIIDLRSAPIDDSGRKLYDGQHLSAKINYLVVQGEPDWEEGVGYKGMRLGEALPIGRNEDVSADRFTLNSPLVSRTHATLYVDKDGALIVEDHGSTNGTTFTQYEDSRKLPQTTESINDAMTLETYERTETSMVRSMDAAELSDWSEYMRKSSARQYDTVNHLMAHEELVPAAGIELDSKAFLISKIMTDGPRNMAVGYVGDPSNPGQMLARFYYHSKSGGGWRSSPGLLPSGHFSKGGRGAEAESAQSEYGQYAQTTKPAEDLSALLDAQVQRQLSAANGDPRMAFTGVTNGYLRELVPEEKINSEQGFKLADEISFKPIDAIGLGAYVSGVGFRGNAKRMRESLRAIELPVGFEPDFSGEPLKAYSAEHAVAGATKIEVFASELEGRAVEWHVAHDLKENRVWVDHIAYRDSGLTTYGTRKEVILAGALSAKPFDYVQQIEGMEVGRDWTPVSATYGDVTATLDRIPAIERYRQARDIHRLP